MMKEGVRVLAGRLARENTTTDVLRGCAGCLGKEAHRLELSDLI